MSMGEAWPGLGGRPRPRLEPETEFFWKSGSEGRLCFLRCNECALYVHPPRAGMSPMSRSKPISRRVSGKDRAVIHHQRSSLSGRSFRPHTSLLS